MAREPEAKSPKSPRISDTLDAVKVLAAHNARAPLDNEESLMLYLRSWWSRIYNKPLKDPILQSYSLEELLYEFYDRVERTKAEQESIEQDNDKIEESKDKEALDWAAQEELKEIEELKAKGELPEDFKTSNVLPEHAQTKVPYDPTKDPANVAWMEEQLKKQKEIHGEDFGENLDLNFEE